MFFADLRKWKSEEVLKWMEKEIIASEFPLAIIKQIGG